jgi:hypothetical protein
LIDILKHIGIVAILVLGSLLAKGDIGETHTLKEERAKLMERVDLLKSDTLNNSSEIVSIQQEMLMLDARIFSSYEETVDRTAAQKLRQGTNDKRVVYLALGISIVALFFAMLLLGARSRLQNKQQSGLRSFYRELAVDFAGQVTAEKANSNRMLRVNIVVIAGLILMSISILAFLIKSL